MLLWFVSLFPVKVTNDNNKVEYYDKSSKVTSSHIFSSQGKVWGANNCPRLYTCGGISMY